MPANPGNVVETLVEAQDFFDLRALHDGEVHGVTCGQGRASLKQVLRRKDVVLLDGKNVVDDVAQRNERRLDGLASIDENVAVQDLLEDLAAGHQAPSSADQPLKNALRGDLVGMVRAEKVHGDVGVDEDHEPAARA